MCNVILIRDTVPIRGEYIFITIPVKIWTFLNLTFLWFDLPNIPEDDHIKAWTLEMNWGKPSAWTSERRRNFVMKLGKSPDMIPPPRR